MVSVIGKDHVLNAWLHESGWHVIRYENSGNIGVAKDWSPIFDGVDMSIRYWNRSNIGVAENPLNIACLTAPGSGWHVVRYWNSGNIRVAKDGLNIQCRTLSVGSGWHVIDIETAEISEWPKMDLILMLDCAGSGWHVIQYWNSGNIGVAEDRVNIQCLTAEVRLTCHSTLEQRKHRSGWTSTQYSMLDYSDQANMSSNIGTSETSEWPKMDPIFNAWLHRSGWHVIQYWDIGNIGVAEDPLNIQCLTA